MQVKFAIAVRPAPIPFRIPLINPPIPFPADTPISFTPFAKAVTLPGCPSLDKPPPKLEGQPYGKPPSVVEVSCC